MRLPGHLNVLNETEFQIVHISAKYMTINVNPKDSRKSNSSCSANVIIITRLQSKTGDVVVIKHINNVISREYSRSA
jgi:hypothetical protein